jgi:hypothetical protein
MTMNDLQRIQSTLDDIVTRLARLEALGSKPQAHAASAGGEVASGRDLEGDYGDPIVKRDPKRWTGPSEAGRRMSECSSAFLECVAEFNDWCAGQAEDKNEMTNAGKPRAPYLRKDAARARGHAERNRGKPAAKASPAAAGGEGNYDADMGDDSIPF